MSSNQLPKERAMPPVEELRWKVKQYGFQSPADFEQRRNEPWLAVGRNHTTWEGGIQREEREAGSAFEIEDNRIAAYLIGRTIVGFEREPFSGEAWGHGENSVTITLNDGSQLYFMGEGYDASGLVTTYQPPETGAA